MIKSGWIMPAVISTFCLLMRSWKKNLCYAQCLLCFSNPPLQNGGHNQPTDAAEKESWYQQQLKQRPHLKNKTRTTFSIAKTTFTVQSCQLSGWSSIRRSALKAKHTELRIVLKLIWKPWHNRSWPRGEIVSEPV